MKSSREVKEAATLAERQRIIKLLTEQIKWIDYEGLKTIDTQELVDLEILIALIKGDNK
jgi:hypothetical protein